MKSVVVYASRYGSTRAYAEWIAGELGCRAVPLRQAGALRFSEYDAVVYGGGLYAGGVLGLKKFLKLLGEPPDTRLFLFMVGITSPADTEFYAQTAEANLPPVLRARFQTFALRGDQLFSKMGFLHRMMMRIPKSAAEKKPPEQRTEGERAFIENYGKDVRYASRESIRPLLGAVRA